MTPQARRALQRLAATGAQLMPARTGAGFALYPGGDRRRRPTARLSNAEVQALCSEGVLARAGDNLVLTEAGVKYLRRETARAGEAFASQHREVIDRAAVGEDGGIRIVRGHDGNARLKRLSTPKDVRGGSLLSAAELAAAAQLMADWDAGQVGVVRGSDWSAAPMGTTRGTSNAQERAMASHCDARARIARVLDRLAPQLRRVVESVCRDEIGLEALERREQWPARSGKLALKLGLAQVAEALRSGFESRARGELDAVHHREETV